MANKNNLRNLELQKYAEKICEAYKERSSNGFTKKEAKPKKSFSGNLDQPYIIDVPLIDDSYFYMLKSERDFDYEMLIELMGYKYNADSSRFIKAFKNFDKATKELTIAWANYNDALEFDSYPFDKNFVLLGSDISEWAKDAIEIIGDLGD